MFTSLQLLHRLTRHLRVRDLAGLSLPDRLELLDAANAGLAEFAEAMPHSRRESPASALLRAPAIIPISIVEGASAFTYVSGGGVYPTGGYSAEAELIGHAVAIAGAPGINRLQRPGELLLPWLGATGDPDATFYGDCVALSEDVMRVLGNPTWADSSGSRELRPARRPWNAGEPIQTGAPECWWTEGLLGHERTSSPLALLRVWPLPAAIGSLTYRVESFITALGLEDFSSPRELPVSAREIPDLAALCSAGLQGSTLLADGVTAGSLDQSAGAARRRLLARPQQPDSAPRRITTKRGW